MFRRLKNHLTELELITEANRAREIGEAQRKTSVEMAERVSSHEDDMDDVIVGLLHSLILHGKETNFLLRAIYSQGHNCDGCNAESGDDDTPPPNFAFVGAPEGVPDWLAAVISEVFGPAPAEQESEDAEPVANGG